MYCAIQNIFDVFELISDLSYVLTICLVINIALNDLCIYQSLCNENLLIIKMCLRILVWTRNETALNFNIGF